MAVNVHNVAMPVLDESAVMVLLVVDVGLACRALLFVEDHAQVRCERIASLVRSGHSNPEIAAILYISVKTVDANLTRIYRKLGLRRRADLARHNIS